MLGVLLMTVPAGWIAGRIGRRATIRIGLLGNILFPVLTYFFPYPVLLYAIFLIFGMSFTLVSVNQIPVIGGSVTSKLNKSLPQKGCLDESVVSITRRLAGMTELGKLIDTFSKIAQLQDSWRRARKSPDIDFRSLREHNHT